MQIAYASLSITGPVRDQQRGLHRLSGNPTDETDWRNRGAIVVLADGVGGQDRGEVASQMACKTVPVETFLESKPLASPTQTLFQMFAAANIAVYDENIKHNGTGRMATTLTVSLFRHNEVNIGHVGDCRVYLIQQSRIRRVTNDHSYAGVQLKLGLNHRRGGDEQPDAIGPDPHRRPGADDPRRLPHCHCQRAATPSCRCATASGPSSPKARYSTSFPSNPPKRHANR